MGAGPWDPDPGSWTLGARLWDPDSDTLDAGTWKTLKSWGSGAGES